MKNDKYREEKATLIGVQAKIFPIRKAIEIANSKPWSFYTGKTRDQAVKEILLELEHMEQKERQKTKIESEKDGENKGKCKSLKSKELQAISKIKKEDTKTLIELPNAKTSSVF